jgi:hypothetical protein
MNNGNTMVYRLLWTSTIKWVLEQLFDSRERNGVLNKLKMAPVLSWKWGCMCMARRLFPDTWTFLCRMEIDHLADVRQSQNFDLHAIEKLFDVFHHCDELAIALGVHQHASGYSSSQNRQKILCVGLLNGLGTHMLTDQWWLLCCNYTW